MVVTGAALTYRFRPLWQMSAATRLLGQSLAGLSATGDSDTRNYYDMIASAGAPLAVGALLVRSSRLAKTRFTN